MSKRIRAIATTLTSGTLDGAEYIALDQQGSDPTAKVLVSEFLTYAQDQLDAGGQSYEAVTNSSGNTTITPTAGDSYHKVKATLSGSGTTRVFIAATTGRVAGDRIRFLFYIPATASLVVEVRNATAGGTLIKTFTASAADATIALLEIDYTGSAWELGPWQFNLASDL